MIKHWTRISLISLLLTCLLIYSPVVGTCAEFHIAPDGQADGDGSITRPWNLAAALAHPQAVQPGDILWLHGGKYRGTFTSRLEGTADKPIVVRQFPGERATLDAADAPRRDSTVVVLGNYTWFQDFEITNSASKRKTTVEGSHPADLTLNGSIDIHSGHGHKLINLVVHHCSAGPSAWLEAIDAEAYGCVVDHGIGKLMMTGNYLASPQGTAAEIQAETLKLSGNIFVGRVGGVDPANHPENTYHGSERPGGVAILVRPNRYEVGRAHIAVFNWDRQEPADVDLSTTGLEQRDRFEIIDAQNYFGEPLATGRYDGSPVKLPMTGLTVADPVAGAPIKPPHTSPEFAVFVVRKAE